MIKEASVIMLNDMLIDIPLYLRSGRMYWWPWVKNYYGTRSVQDGFWPSIAKFVWIDQDLKAEMGY
jgi:hypothetical protein